MRKKCNGCTTNIQLVGGVRFYPFAQKYKNNFTLYKYEQNRTQ